MGVKMQVHDLFGDTEGKIDLSIIDEMAKAIRSGLILLCDRNGLWS